jgi:prolyl-tRNA editing enzyme YbaK/EbsC (Cys-tRNA(Pro) deacylase)
VEEVKNKILTLIRTNNYWHETFEHQDVRTSQEAAQIRIGYSLSQGAKAMIVKAGESSFVMLVIPADKKIDSKKAKKVLNSKSFRFATEEELLKITRGVLPGAVPPFGSLFGLKTYTDPGLFANEKIVFNAGLRGFSVAIKSEDYKNLEKPKVVELCD